MQALGTHLLLEMRDCNSKTLSNLEFVTEAMKNAALEAKATIVEVAFHEFSPFGISGCLLIGFPIGEHPSFAGIVVGTHPSMLGADVLGELYFVILPEIDAFPQLDVHILKFSLRKFQRL